MRFAVPGAVSVGCLIPIGILVMCFGIHLDVSAASEPPSSVFGEYHGAGCPSKGQPGSCLPTGASDRIRILPGEGADALVNVKIVFEKGHSCTLEGEATWVEDHFTLRADGLDPAKPCQLELRLSDSELKLNDAGARCREVYCGTRGAFDGARFKKEP